MEETAPAILTVDGSPQGQALAVHSNSAELAALPNFRLPARPALSGELISCLLNRYRMCLLSALRLNLGGQSRRYRLRATAIPNGWCLSRSHFGFRPMSRRFGFPQHGSHAQRCHHCRQQSHLCHSPARVTRTANTILTSRKNNEEASDSLHSALNSPSVSGRLFCHGSRLSMSSAPVASRRGWDVRIWRDLPFQSGHSLLQWAAWYRRGSPSWSPTRSSPDRPPGRSRMDFDDPTSLLQFDLVLISRIPLIRHTPSLFRMGRDHRVDCASAGRSLFGRHIPLHRRAHNRSFGHIL